MDDGRVWTTGRQKWPPRCHLTLARETEGVDLWGRVSEEDVTAPTGEPNQRSSGVQDAEQEGVGACCLCQWLPRSSIMPIELITFPYPDSVVVSYH